ncbi:hypothetical protein PILCRDRAFT_814451 [Piloderma croceum F 1598]|uniref:Uncharacterized protein n=1 Tax=Piloderma croceum (strain F 1598) TaxID=765440 RepID=A0A0C3FTS1_PILCF|nr:hypothetical protein PILCRDRAFT_814451 [Piloderma croceum F 1598]
MAGSGNGEVKVGSLRPLELGCPIHQTRGLRPIDYYNLKYSGNRLNTQTLPRTYLSLAHKAHISAEEHYKLNVACFYRLHGNGDAARRLSQDRHISRGTKVEIVW